MTKLHSLPLVALVVPILSLGCALAEPKAEDVCRSPDTLREVRGALFAFLLGDPRGLDAVTVRSAFEQVVTFDSIRLDGEDRGASKISCRARVTSPSNHTSLEVEFDRQKEAGTDRFIFTTRVIPDDAWSWRSVAGDVVTRFHQLSIKPSKSVETKATPQAINNNLTSLPEVAANFAASAVTAENARSRRDAVSNGESVQDAFRYDASKPSTLTADVDRDGDLDAVVLVTLCESVNCHLTTKSAVVGLFRNMGDRYEQSSSRVYEGDGRLVRFTQAGAIVETTQFGPDDPDCCPTQVRQQTLQF